MKKKEKALQKELEQIKHLKNEHTDLQELENRMSLLIEKAAKHYQDQLDQNMSPFYFEYGSLLLQRLEDANEASENSLNCVEISQNDRELKNSQLAFENLETAKTIIRNKLDKQNIEMYKLQEMLTNTRIKITETKVELSLCFMRIGDLQQWREDYTDALQNFQSALDQLEGSQNFKELSVVHYKIANSLLQQNSNDCEQLALQHLKESFKFCYESTYNEECEIDLSEKNLKVIQVDSELLKRLLEKIEDTYLQMKEVKQCQEEIEKWRSNQPILEDQIVYLGKLTPGCDQLGDMKIKRKKL